MRFLILFIAVFAADVSSKVLPDFIPQCKRKDPELIKCIVSAVDKVKPYLLKGIPQIKVPPYEPLEIPKLTIDRNLDAIRIKAKVDKMKVWGPSSFKLKNLKVDLDKYSAELTISLPHLYVESDYDVAGRLLLIPLGGKGKLKGNFTDCTAISKGNAKVITKKGVQFLEVDKFSSKVRVGGGRVHFQDKDGSNALIAETAAAFFNANPRLVLDIMNPIVEDSSNAIFTAFSNRILGSIPLSELIPDE